MDLDNRPDATNSLSSRIVSDCQIDLLAEFVRPYTSQEVLSKRDWDVLLGEPAALLINRFEAEGILVRQGELLACSVQAKRELAQLMLARPRSRKPPDPFGDDDSLVPAIWQQDLRKPECPACGKPLRKVPGSKTKCPHCSAFMFVRTRPSDRARVLVTEQGATEIEMQWQHWPSADEPQWRYMTTRLEVDAERERLRVVASREGSPEPTEDDVKWALLLKWANQHTHKGEWGLFRNMQLSMADFLLFRNRYDEALGRYLYVCALDLNGPCNRRDLSDELLREFPMFDLRMSFLAPAVVDQVKKLAWKLHLSTAELEQRFLQAAALKPLPLPGPSAWKALNSALVGDIDLNDQPACFKKLRSLLK